MYGNSSKDAKNPNFFLLSWNSGIRSKKFFIRKKLEFKINFSGYHSNHRKIN